MLYNAVMSVNNRMIMGERIEDTEKKMIVDLILNRCSRNQQEIEYLKSRSENMYPHYLVPTCEEKSMERSKKPRLITGELPKTLILAYNAYELEALRLLSLWGAGGKEAESILALTAQRLEQTCFGWFCEAGECTGATVAFLRFWSVYRPDDTEKIYDIIAKFSNFRDRRGTWRNGIDLPHFYFWLALECCETPGAVHEIEYSSQHLHALLKKGWIYNENTADRYNLIRKYIVRNTLARLPQYKHLEDAEVYIGENGRVYSKY